MSDPELRIELLNLLASHAGQPMDYVALFMFLNTVAGGHYQERYAEDRIRQALSEMVANGEIEAWRDNHRLERVEPGVTVCLYRLPV